MILLAWQTCLSFPVNHGLSLLNDKNVLVGMHISSQKRIYEVTASVSLSRSVAAASKIYCSYYNSMAL